MIGACIDGVGSIPGNGICGVGVAGGKGWNPQNLRKASMLN